MVPTACDRQTATGPERAETLVLPARLDLTAARRLCVDLRIHAKGPLILDASQVDVFGGLCLQVLLSAQQHWARLGNSLTIKPRSAAFVRALEQFGVSPAQLERNPI